MSRAQKISHRTGLRRKAHLATFATLPLRGYLDGFILSNDTDTDHDINIAAGACRDADNGGFIVSDSEFTKQLDVDWAAGDDAGGFPSGLTLSNTTWYHVFVIGQEDGTVDGGFDTSLTATNLLSDAGSDYTMYRRVGSVRTDGSANALQFTQVGNHVRWDDPPLDVNETADWTSVQTLTLQVPTGVRTIALFHFAPTALGASDTVYFKPTDVSDETPSLTAAPLGTLLNAQHADIEVLTDTSAQINARVNSDNSATFKIATLGYEDFRGRDA